MKITRGNNVTYDLSGYKTFKKLFRDIYYGTFEINKAERKQDEFNVELNTLSEYAPRDQNYIQAKNDTLNNAKNFYKGGEKKLLKVLKMEYLKFTMMMMEGLETVMRMILETIMVSSITKI